MQSKDLEILKNITIQWTNILSPIVCVMNEYKVLLVKMKLDSTAPEKDSDNKKAKIDNKFLKMDWANLKHLSNIEILLGLLGVLSMLKCIHSLL